MEKPEKSKGSFIPELLEPAAPHTELFQFSDGAMAIRYRAPGYPVIWESNQHTKRVDRYGGAKAIVGMESNEFYAVGDGFVIKLAAYNRTAGGFKAAGWWTIGDVATGRLPDVTISQPWIPLTGQGAVREVVIDLSKDNPTPQAATEIEVPSPFILIRSHMRHALLDMTKRAGYPPGFGVFD